MDSRVRQLLKSLIGMDLEKCYAERTVRNTERSHFALMNDEMLANVSFRIPMSYIRVAGHYET